MKDGKFTGPSCAGCGHREVVFKGEGTQQKFGQWLFHQQHKGFTVMAHNNKGYDGYFLMDYLLQNSVHHQIIFEGAKIMQMSIHSNLNMTVIDSLNFLPMKLASFAKAFGLDAQKGDFPHYFNIGANWNYVGPYPPPEMYGVDAKNTSERSTFCEWHRQQEGKLFNFQEEMLHYCRGDVNLLREGCLQFRKLMMEITDGVDPFQYVTIASVCMAIYRGKLMPVEYKVKVDDGLWERALLRKEDYLVKRAEGWVVADNITHKQYVSSPIAQVPAYGYNTDQFSHDSIAWMEMLMENSRQEDQPIHIQHALNGGEHLVPNTKYKLDGFCVVTKTAYEYHVSFNASMYLPSSIML
jgi:hypothetical protein